MWGCHWHRPKTAGQEGIEKDQAKDDGTDNRFHPDPNGSCRGTDTSEDVPRIVPKGKEDASWRQYRDPQDGNIAARCLPQANPSCC